MDLNLPIDNMDENFQIKFVKVQKRNLSHEIVRS